MQTHRGVLVIRIADDCGACSQRVASGQIAFIQSQVAKYYDVVISEVAERFVGDPTKPDIFNYPKFTPYFMFMLKSTYDIINSTNPPINNVIRNLRLYNWKLTGDLDYVKNEIYERFFEDMLKFCHDTYLELTGFPNPKVVSEASESTFVLRKIRVRPMNFTA